MTREWTPTPWTLRPYQVEALHAISRAWSEGHARTLLVLATGLGKTTVFAEVARRRAMAGRKPTLVVAHRIELVEQAAQRLRAAGLGVSIESGESVAMPFAMVDADAVVATVQTLRGRRLEKWPVDYFGTVVCDEAHHAAAASYRAILDRFDEAVHLGVTATPDRGDQIAIGHVYPHLAYEFGIRAGIEAGYLAPIRSLAIDTPSVDLSSVRVTKQEHGRDLSADDLAAAMRGEAQLHELAAPIAREAGDRQTLVFVPSVEIAHALAGVLAGYVGADRVRSLDGGTDRATRADVLSEYQAGRVQVLVNCLDESTEILTRRGWQSIDTIRDDDETAAISDGRVTWEPIDRVVRRERAPGERMVRVENQTLDVRVTEGHRMLVRAPGARGWRIVEASTLPERVGAYQFPLAAVADAEQVATPSGSTSPADLSLDECRFIGLWIADGHLDRSGGHRGITISQSDRYTEANAEIRRILTACGFDWRHSESRVANSPHVQHRYSVPKGSIGGALARNGFARLECYLDKDFSPILFGLNPEQTRALIEGVWLGDGVKQKSRAMRNGVRSSWHIVNTNAAMLDRLQRLAVLRGFAANLSGPRDNGPLATMPIYTLRIRQRAAVTTNNHTIATSGGNPARFESEWRPERVWCVTNRTGTILTRRGGKVLAMGQCALFTEGFDAPATSCVAVARPTKSRALYAQMVGRGTRLAEGKADLLLLNLAPQNCGHSLIGPTDLFDGNDLPEDIAAEVKAAAERGEPVLQAIAKGEEIAREREEARARERERAAIVAEVHYRKTHVDPFAELDIDEPGEGDRRGPRATDRQAEVLERAGFKSARSLSRREAGKILDELTRRRQRGLCTVKQMRALRKQGLRGDLSFEEARAALDALAANRWKITPEIAERWGDAA